MGVPMPTSITRANAPPGSALAVAAPIIEATEITKAPIPTRMLHMIRR
jgi:hypothetical protein